MSGLWILSWYFSLLCTILLAGCFLIGLLLLNRSVACEYACRTIAVPYLFFSFVVVRLVVHLVVGENIRKNVTFSALSTFFSTRRKVEKEFNVSP